MLDRNGHELSVGDEVFYYHADFGYPMEKMVATITDIRGEIDEHAKVVFLYKRWRLVRGSKLEYASPEELFLWKLQQ